MARTCIVTGSNGYVGSCVVRAFARAGWRVVEMTRAAKPDAIPFRLGENVPVESLAGADALVHCAYDFKQVTRDEIRATNVRGAEKLFDAATRAGVAKLVCISTISAFDGCNSLYGQAKLEIEKIATRHGALVIRPGLVWGDHPGGMLGKLKAQVEKSKVVPLIGDGTQIQYLVHDEDLCGFIERHCSGGVESVGDPITAANEMPWKFRDVLAAIAAQRGKSPMFVRLPWRAIWLALKVAEILGARLTFRSDSVISLMNPNPAPSFAGARAAGLRCRPFNP